MSVGDCFCSPGCFAEFPEGAHCSPGPGNASKVPVVQVFMQNIYFDPWEQTLLVGELANMTDVRNTKVYIERAIGAMRVKGT